MCSYYYFDSDDKKRKLLNLYKRQFDAQARAIMQQSLDFFSKKKIVQQLRRAIGIKIEEKK